MSRHRPLLESLEGRAVPAMLQNLASADAPTGAVTLDDLPDPSVLRALSQEFAVPLDETQDEDAADGQTFTSPEALPDALLEQLTLRRAAALMFPASGGTDAEPKADELAALLPYAPMLEETGTEQPPEPPGPPAEQSDAEESAIECTAAEDGADGAGVEAL